MKRICKKVKTVRGAVVSRGWWNVNELCFQEEPLEWFAEDHSKRKRLYAFERVDGGES